MSANNYLSLKFFVGATLASARLFSKTYHRAWHRALAPAQGTGVAAQHARGCTQSVLCDPVFRRALAGMNHAQSLSTICVDNIVHSLQKKNLSGLRKRLFCRCPQFEPIFLIF
jgi:hypothetical protein